MSYMEYYPVIESTAIKALPSKPETLPAVASSGFATTVIVRKAS